MPPGANLLTFDFLARDRASKVFDDLRGKVSKMGPALAAGGAVAGAALTAGIASAMEMETATAKLEASLGATTAVAGAAGEAAGALYSQGYGASMDEVSTAVGAVVTSIDGMQNASADAVQDMTAKAMTIANVFGVDVTRAAQVAGQMITSGLAKDGAQAMDLLTASMQAVPAAVREDILDAVDEYGPFMRTLGIEGEQAMNLLVAGAEKGAFGIDKTGDALKEFTIRATDMSTATGEAFTTLGMNQEEMTTKLLAGGDTAEQAFNQIIQGLLGITDPAAQSQAALALFGTPLEDLNTAEIPQFLQSLDATNNKLGEVEGATAAAGEAMRDTAATKVTAFQRAVETTLAGLVNMDGVMGDAAVAVSGLGAAILPVGGDLGGLALAMGTLGGVGAKLKSGGQAAIDWIMSIGTRARETATSVGQSFRAMSTASKVATVGLGAAGIALAAVAVATDLFSQSNAEAKAQVEELAATLDASTGAITADTEAKIANRLETEGALEAADRLGISYGTVVDAATGNQAAMETLNAALAEHGDVQQQAAFRAIGTGAAMTEEEQAALLLSETVPTLSGQLDEAAASQQRVAEGTDEAAGAQGELDTQLQATTTSVEDQWGNVEQLTDKLNELTDTVFAAQRANIAYQEAVASATETAAENGAALDRNTEAGRENHSALLDLAEAALTERDAMIENGKAHDEVVTQLTDARAQFIAVALQMGMSKIAAENYANSLGLIPDQVATAVTNTATAAAIPVDILEAKYQGATVPRFTPMSNSATVAGIPVDAYEAKLQGATVPRSTTLTNNAGAAQGPVNAYNSAVSRAQRTVTTTIRTVYNTVGQPPPKGGFFAEGGPVSRGQVAVVGEEGPELVAFGSPGRVFPADETARILADARSGGASGSTVGGMGGGGQQRLIVDFDFRPTGNRLLDALVDELRRGIRVRGGNVQTVLGQR